MFFFKKKFRQSVSNERKKNYTNKNEKIEP